MGWGGKGKGKPVKGGGNLAKWAPKKEQEVEAEADEEDDDDEEVAITGDDDEEWLAFQSAVLAKLVGSGEMTAGKLGHELGAKKKPVAAALYALMESGMVEKNEGTPPRWAAKDGIDESELINAPISERYQYDASKKRAAPGGGSSRASFETLKLLVRSHLKPGGVTGGAMGYTLGASKKVVNGALYACEKDGTAWTVSDRESGIKLRWAGVAVKCNEELPDCFRYAGSQGQADGQPPMKRARVMSSGGGASGTGDDFEDMKTVCWAAVAAKGEKGVTSGMLGFELGCDRKAITASLYACMKEGKVNNVGEDGTKPRWQIVQDPPASAMNMEVPERYGYKGDKVPKAPAQQKTPGHIIPQFQVKQQQIVLPNMEGLTPKQQAALAKKGGGKGAVVAQKVNTGVSIQGPAAANAVAFLNEWCQKSKKQLAFPEAGQDGSGEFLCQCVVDGQEVAVAGARNKKQAKMNAATAALSALGLA